MRIALIGCGYIGGSLALALRQVYPTAHFVAFEPQDSAASLALARGIVDERAPTLASLVSGADVAIVAVPVAASVEVLRQLGGLLSPRTIVTDVGSVKGAVVEAASRWLPAPERFVGGHPIAGREHSGPASATAELFRGTRCLLTPRSDTDPVALEWVRASWSTIGATVELMEPGYHDRVMATASHLPHLVAYALAYSAGLTTVPPVDGGALEDLVGRTGGSFADTTRVAASAPAMWRDIFRLNRDAVRWAAVRYRDAFERLLELVDTPPVAEDRAVDPIIEYLTEARTRRERVVGTTRVETAGAPSDPARG